MIPVNTLISKLNDIITAGGLSELELAQIFGAIDSLENNGVNSVVSSAYLPAASENKGRFFYIINETRYTFSNGSSWDVNNILLPPSVNLYAWGINTYGGLGDGTITNRSSPVSVVGGFADWIQADAGTLHTLGIRTNGTAWAWGNNAYGRLGDGTTTNSSSPVSIVGGFTDWVQVSGGDEHSLGIRANGTAWAWGYNGSGRLGNGTTTSSRSPVSVVGGFTDWIQVSAGAQHSLGIRANGTAWAWGNGSLGKLGNAYSSNQSSPVSVVGGFTDWTQVSAGNFHSLGVRANGTAWGWGYNGGGRLGDNTTDIKSSPVSVVGGFTDWIQVSTGVSHSLGVRANGTAWGWGDNSYGRLGDGTTYDKTSPVSVVGGFTDWTQVSAGSSSFAIRSNGTAWAWGYNGGLLGDGTTTHQSSPVSVIGGFTDWIQINAFSTAILGIRA